MNSFFENKKVLLTGGLGFIGSNLAAQLIKQGAIVTIVDSLIPEYGGNLFNIESIKDKVSVNISDVRDPHAMKFLIQGQDYLFNLAGQTSHMDSMHNPFTDLDINAKAQLSILESCRQFNPEIKVIFASTRQIYGKPQYLPVDEKHPLVPVDVNGINKQAGESFHLLYNEVYGIRSTILRLTNTYGPHMRVKDARQTFLGIWIRRLLEGEPIFVFGDGKQLRDYNYVDDVVDAMLIAAQSEKSNQQIYNLGDDHKECLSETAKSISTMAGNGNFELVPFPSDRKAIDIGDYYTDSTKFQKDFNWRPKVSLTDGLSKTVEFYKQHLKHYI